jgi:hypothetical protein
MWGGDAKPGPIEMVKKGIHDHTAFERKSKWKF